MALLTPDQAAKELGISVRQLKDLVDDGLVKWINVGRGDKRPSRRFSAEDLDQFKRDRTVTSCRSTKSEKAQKPTGTTSGYKVIDFQATLEQLRSERRRRPSPEKGSRPKLN